MTRARTVGPREVCAICGVNESAPGKGEHVWPAWFLKDADKAGPPKYGWRIGGEPITNKSGPLHFNQRQRVLLPACEPCNQTLNKRFEQPAKELVRRLVAENWTGAATVDEWRTVGLWLAKVLLLFTNPHVRYDHPTISARARDLAAPWDPSHYRWLIDGSAPPRSLSLWVFRADDRPPVDRRWMFCPTSVTDQAGHRTPFPHSDVTQNSINMTLLSHPGWELRHPLVENGTAWELLHDAHAGDLSALPTQSLREVRWRSEPIKLQPGYRLDWTLPPLQLSEGPWPPEILDVVEWPGTLLGARN